MEPLIVFLKPIRPYHGHRHRREALKGYIRIVALLAVLLATMICLCSAYSDESITSTASTSNTNKQDISEFRASQAVEIIRDWALRFGRDIHYGTQEATCLRSIKDQFDPSKSNSALRGDYKASIVSIDWATMHDEIVKTISNTMSWHKSAVEKISRASEELAANHQFNKSLRFDYVDVHRLHNLNDEFLDENGEFIDQSSDGNLNSSNNSTPSNQSPDGADDGGLVTDQEVGQLDADSQLISNPSNEPPIEPLPTPSKLQSYTDQINSSTINSIESPTNSGSNSQTEWQTPIRYLKLNKHRNFGDVLISTEESAVHIPVHIFPGESQVMNGIAWSDQLTKVFRENFIRNPKLTNQYFASQNGFMRLFPAQKWQIARTDPDLYDARMRPWYVAGASSRKDVVILVDSSGSMTGSRRDIAKGVVFEILDTLTDNDHFLILKFSDTIQQVGVPSCRKMRMEKRRSSIPLKNTLFHMSEFQAKRNENETDIDSLFLMPATGRNVRHVKTNFTIPTSGIANFSNALATAFEVLRNYQDSEQFGSQCNQAIMLITDGSPSDFENIFNRYNYPNAPVRVFTYLIGREAGDDQHTKMMACHNRGYYTHVINLAEVRETVQQYIPVMARPLVLDGSHPITWTPAYGELTYQILTDWIWESKRRDKARAILAALGRGSPSNAIPEIRITDSGGGGGGIYSTHDSGGDGGYGNIDGELTEDEIDAIDLFGYNSNTDCFWQTHRNDLLTTVVQPVYDRKNESIITEKFLVKNVWTIKETKMRTAQILGVAAADMKINDIIALAPSHKLGANGYAIMLTNNGFAMHHPDLRSILEPFNFNDPSDRNMRILKPFFSSLDFTQVEHISDSSSDGKFLTLRKEAVSGLVGWHEFRTKRTVDCQKRVQTRVQQFFFKPIQEFPFSFMIAIPQPYGSHRVEAQINVKNPELPEKLTTYFTTNDFDIYTVHPDYQYCDGPSNNSIATLLDVFQRIEAQKKDDIQWRQESSKPPVFFPGKIVCDKDLVQSLVYDAVATFGFSETCPQPSLNAESSLLGMLGVRFSFITTRSGLTRVRHYESGDPLIRTEMLAFAKKHNRAIDETFYSRTVDFNMLNNNNATLIQVPFNIHEKIRDRLNRYDLNQVLRLDTGHSSDPSNPSSLDVSGIDASLDQDITPRLNVKDMSLLEKLDILTNSSLHAIATQSIIVNEGAQRAVAGVTGVFYDYATFVLRFFNSTNSRFQDNQPSTKPASCFTDNPNDEACNTDYKSIKCGLTNDTIDCLLIDNNGYIVVSEDLDYIGRHLKAYDSTIMHRLVSNGVFREINITDYQSVCMKQEEKQITSSAFPSLIRPVAILTSLCNLVTNLMVALSYVPILIGALIGNQAESSFAQPTPPFNSKPQQTLQPMLSLLPNKTYLRPCEKTLTLYETLPGSGSKSAPGSDSVEHYKTHCDCKAWFVYEQVPKTNLIMLIVDTTDNCRHGCDSLPAQQIDPTDPIDAKYANTEDQVCNMLERESQLHRKKLDSCFSQHPDEGYIKLCGSAGRANPMSKLVLIVLLFISSKFLFSFP